MSSHTNIARYVIYYVLAFLLSLSIVISSLLGVAITTVGSPKYMISCLNSSGYYARTALEIETGNYETNGLPGGMPEEVFTGSVSLPALRQNVEDAVKAAYQGDTFQLNRDFLEADLYQRFVDYASSHDYELSDELRQNLRNMAEYCIDDYQQHMINPYVLQSIRYISPYLGYLPYIMAGSVVLSVALFLFLYAIRRYKHRAIRFLQYSMCGAGCMLTIGPLWVLLSGIVGRLALTSQSLYTLANTYVNNVLTSCIYTGIALILIACTLVMLLYRFLKSRVE